MQTLSTIANCPDPASAGWYQRLNNMDLTVHGAAFDLQMLGTDVGLRQSDMLIGRVVASINRQEEPFGGDNQACVASVDSSLRTLISVQADYEAFM